LYRRCPSCCPSPTHLSTSVLILFVILRRLPRSTLLPYTTLFRSLSIQPLATEFQSCRGPSSSKLGVRSAVPNHGKGALNFRKGKDRKSTRLNSSHVKISYAVFCLKKKKA